MSLVSVLPYFRTRMNSLGHKRWDDALNFDNIPDAIFDRAYHLEVSTALGTATEQQLVMIDMPINVRLFLQGTQQTDEVRDRGLEFSDAIIADIVCPANFASSNLTKIVFNSVSIEAEDDSNDNSMIFVLGFTATTGICRL